jgi:hypothetical protein
MIHLKIRVESFHELRIDNFTIEFFIFIFIHPSHPPESSTRVIYILVCIPNPNPICPPTSNPNPNPIISHHQNNKVFHFNNTLIFGFFPFLLLNSSPNPFFILAPLCQMFFKTIIKQRQNINTKVVASNSALYEKLKSVLDGFNAPIRYAVAYGSGAYPQKGYDDQTIGKDTMVFTD